MGRRVACLAVVVGVLSTTSVARAEGDPVLAETLFREARELMGRGEYAPACAKLEESQRLDPGGGTLLLLASCHEAIGKLATAWTEYREAVALAKRDNRSDRLAAAQARVDALEPRLSYLVIEVDPAAHVEGLEILRDGAAVPRVAWGTKVPADLGEHVVAARAPGYDEAKVTVTIAEESAVETVSVPRLHPTPPPEPPPPIAPPAPPPPAPESGSAMRTLGLVIGGVGLASLGAGTFFGVRSLSRTSDVEALCDPRSCDDPRAVPLRDDALRDANIANVTIAVGLVGVAVGTIMFLVAPKPSAPRTGTR